MSNLGRLANCDLCDFSGAPLNTRNNRGSVMIYKTGASPEKDWYAVLQPDTPSDPTRGFSIQMMPMAHVESFGQLKKYRELSANMGLTQAMMSHAMDTVLREEGHLAESEPSPGQIMYGKYGTSENTQSHLHIKLVPFLGDVAQPGPTDAGWAKKSIERIDGQNYVRALPVKRHELTQERLNDLALQLNRIL